ncbi:hypothetical protein ACFSQW_11630 [Sphingobacterium tabacisoli]|uniref:Uncharacterized protein n=1 Tax=Sphingobacterium tabacisoli TaxID=2044855 RepID=A0ABW5L3D5_9SPHI
MTNLSIAAQVSKSHLINGEYHRLYQDDLGGYDYTLFRTPSEILLEVNLRNGRLLLARLSELSDPSSTTIHCKSLESHRLDLEIECSIGLIPLPTSRRHEQLLLHGLPLSRNRPQRSAGKDTGARQLGLKLYSATVRNEKQCLYHYFKRWITLRSNKR